MADTLQDKMKKVVEYEKKIKQERKWVDIKPYSYNIISLMLRAIDDLELDCINADDIIVKHRLDELGW